MNNSSCCCCLTSQKKNKCNCFESIDFPIPCSVGGVFTTIWMTNTANPYGTFIITACADLEATGTIQIFVNDPGAGSPVATLSAGQSFAYTASLLQSVTLLCTTPTTGTCTITASLNVCFN